MEAISNVFGNQRWSGQARVVVSKPGPRAHEKLPVFRDSLWTKSGSPISTTKKMNKKNNTSWHTKII